MSEQRTDVQRRQQNEPSKGETVAVASVFLGVIGLFGALVWADTKEQKKREEESKARVRKIQQERLEREQWLNDEYDKGNIVYTLSDGSYLVVPRVSEQRIVIK